MNENPPPFEPQQPAPAPPPGGGTPPKPPSFALMFGLGVLSIPLGVGACALFQSPEPFGYLALAAFVTVFFKGYRGVFAGFVSAIGLILLVAAVICGVMGMPKFGQ